MSVFWHLGTTLTDYRGMMKAQGDFRLGGKLIQHDRVVIAEQTHSDLVHVCSADDGGAGFGAHPQIPVADALISQVSGLYLLIRTADCFPVLLQSLDGKAVGAAHSGREGTRKNIAGKTVAAMRDAFGVNPRDLIAHIGAGICAEHYQVDPQTWQHFNDSMLELGFYPDQSRPRLLDIRRCIFQQLIAAGVTFRNIEQECVCTFESAEHFSFRKDGTRNRQINLIGIEYE